MISKDQKKKYIDEMTIQFDKSEAVIVTHYQGLTVSQLDELRKRMREHGIIFKITKNRITKLALEKTRCKDISNLFTGDYSVTITDFNDCEKTDSIYLGFDTDGFNDCFFIGSLFRVFV